MMMMMMMMSGECRANVSRKGGCATLLCQPPACANYKYVFKPPDGGKFQTRVPPGCRLGASPLAAATSRRGAASPSRPLRDALGRARLRAHARPVPSARARPRLELAFGRRRHLRSRTRRRRVFARAGSDAGRAPAPRTRLPPLTGGMSAINVTSVQVLVRPALVPPRTRLRGPLVRPPRRDPSEGRRSSSRERGPEARLPRSSPPRPDRRPTRARNRRPPPTSPPRRRITPSTS